MGCQISSNIKTGSKNYSVFYLLCSPDLMPSDFRLFTEVKMTMQGKHFESIKVNKVATTVHPKALIEVDFQICFRKWKEPWGKGVQSQENILRKNNGHMVFTVMNF